MGKHILALCVTEMRYAMLGNAMMDLHASTLCSTHLPTGVCATLLPSTMGENTCTHGNKI